MNVNGVTEFETPWFRIERSTELRLGEPYYVLRAPNAVIIFALSTDNQIILVRQKRIARGHFTLECPAGAIGPDELPEDAARRELLEETGFEAGEIHSLGRGGLGLDRDTAIMHGFFVSGARKVDGAAPEDGIEVQLMPMKEFLNMVRSGNFEQLAALGVIFTAFLRFKGLLAGALFANIQGLPNED